MLRHVIVTPRAHWAHHSRWRPETDSNFASVLSLWDRIFESSPLRDDPASIEPSPDGDDEERSKPLSGMLLRPFRKDG